MGIFANINRTWRVELDDGREEIAVARGGGIMVTIVLQLVTFEYKLQNRDEYEVDCLIWSKYWSHMDSLFPNLSSSTMNDFLGSMNCSHQDIEISKRQRWINEWINPKSRTRWIVSKGVKFVSWESGGSMV